MPPEDTTERLTLIDAIRTPLAFLVYAVAVIETLLGGLALASAGADRTFLIYAIPGILVLVILLVAGVAFFRPEALWGKRHYPLGQTFAAGLGEELYTALDGYLRNMEESAREEAYEQLREIILTSTPAKSNRTAKKFCEVLVDTAIRRAKLLGKKQKKGAGG